MKLFFRKYGEGKPLIILHGLYGSSDNWVTVGKELCKKFTVYLIDQRNHGQSGHDIVHNYDAMAEDLHEFFLQEHIEKAYIMGHSMGGKVAMFFSLYNPDFVEKLIVVDISPMAYSFEKIASEHQRIINALMDVKLYQAKSLQDIDKMLQPAILEVRLRSFLLKNIKKNLSGIFFWKINLSVLNNELLSVFEGLNQNSVINIPTLFIKGELSSYLKEKDIEIINMMFPQSTIKIIKNAGHWVHAEQPIEFNEIVAHFLLTGTT